VSTTQRIRHRFLTILILAFSTSALSLAALVHLADHDQCARVERARDAVTKRWSGLPVIRSGSSSRARRPWSGMRAGEWTKRGMRGVNR